MSGAKFYHIVEAGKVQDLASLAEALDSVKSGGYIWLDFSQPTREDLQALAEPFGLHPLSIEDSLDFDQVPKMEDYPGYTFILVNTFVYREHALVIDELDLFIGEKFLITVSRLDSTRQTILDGFAHVTTVGTDNFSQGPAYLMHVILDRVVDQKFTAIELLENDLDTVEEGLLADLRSFSPSSLLQMRRDLLGLRKSLFHEREIFNKLSRRDCPYIPDKAIVHYRDIYDHLAKSFELTESLRDIVTSLMEMYLSMVNNEIAQTSNQVNITVRRLTLITVVFMPLTLISGIFGMSEYSMMTGPENWRIAYPAFFVVMAMIGITSYFVLRWFQRRDEPGR